LQDESTIIPEAIRSAPEAERRQLTVMFCDLVGSTDLSVRLDPEDLREVVRAYQEMAAEVIQRYEGHIAQYLGDGLLVYFGYPLAHEDDAQRAVYAGLGISEAIATLNTRLEAGYGVQLAVRIGIHTGPVVVGEMGGGGRHENLALGETPNIAARLEGLAQPNTVAISPVTARLVQRTFILETLGAHELKGVAEAMTIARAVGPRKPDQDSEDAATGGFEALVGRDEERGLLLRRWEQSKEGLGQVVLITGEAGIGKSSLVQGLRHHVRQEGDIRIVFRCLPYTTNSALYPILEHIQRVLDWQPNDTADAKLTKLEHRLQGYRLAPDDTVPLLASLLSLPLPEDRYPSLAWTPQQQRQQTQDALVAWLLEEAERQPILAVWEDLHWADPSTLEILDLFIDQTPTAAMLHVLTFRPEFDPPWPTRSHMTPLTLNRLERLQIEAVMTRLAHRKTLPQEVIEHVVTKTDGVPLFVEELTKMLLDSELLEEESDHYELTGPLLTMTIPDTLQGSLMARLDQMNTAKEVAQLGSVLGREFAYDILQAVAPLDEATLQDGLAQLVEAELLYQRGRPPRAKYIFKHALIQDAAYASLLRHTRQQVHQQIAQTLLAHFPEIIETQPEWVAYHYTEAACAEQAIPYWQQAGQRARERWANQEAISHLTAGIELLKTLPQTPERTQQELALQVPLGAALLMTKGHGAPEVEATYTRAHDLCRQLGDTSDLFPVLFGLWRFYAVRPAFQTILELGEELFRLAQGAQIAPLLVVAHYALGFPYLSLGKLGDAQRHFDTGVALYVPEQRSSTVFRAGQDPGVACLLYGAWVLWLRGYPRQALEREQEALALARELADPFTLAFVRCFAAVVRSCGRDISGVQEHAGAALVLAAEHGFTLWVNVGRILRGWATTMQEPSAEATAEAQQALATFHTAGIDLIGPFFLTLVAEAYELRGQLEESRHVLADAQALLDRTGERWWEAEVYRRTGELLLAQSVQQQAVPWLQQALDIARAQDAKSLELRAATSLARLWQSQDKRSDAHKLLAPVYEWFTEGFDTADLQEAKSLLEELA
jgi:class 3 adenylate cyclase/predicted ATPase